MENAKSYTSKINHLFNNFFGITDIDILENNIPKFDLLCNIHILLNNLLLKRRQVKKSTINYLYYFLIGDTYLNNSLFIIYKSKNSFYKLSINCRYPNFIFLSIFSNSNFLNKMSNSISKKEFSYIKEKYKLLWNTVNKKQVICMFEKAIWNYHLDKYLVTAWLKDKLTQQDIKELVENDEDQLIIGSLYKRKSTKIEMRSMYENLQYDMFDIMMNYLQLGNKNEILNFVYKRDTKLIQYLNLDVNSWASYKMDMFYLEKNYSRLLKTGVTNIEDIKSDLKILDYYGIDVDVKYLDKKITMIQQAKSSIKKGKIENNQDMTTVGNKISYVNSNDENRINDIKNNL